MSSLLQPAIADNDSKDLARQAAIALGKLKAELPAREFLSAILRALGDIQGECRAKEQFYRCRNQLELAMRFDNATRAALGANIAVQVAFDYEREESIRQQMARESAAARDVL